MSVRQSHPKYGEGVKGEINFCIFRSKISLFKTLSGCLSSLQLASIEKCNANKSNCKKINFNYIKLPQSFEAQRDDK